MSNDEPSPYCAPYFSRKMTEELWRLLCREHPQKKWEPHRKAILRALNQNAGNRHYTEEP